MRSVFVAATVALSMAIQISAAPIVWNIGSTATSQVERDVPVLARGAEPELQPLVGDLIGLKRSTTDDVPASRE